MRQFFFLAAYSMVVALIASSVVQAGPRSFRGCAGGQCGSSVPQSLQPVQQFQPQSFVAQPVVQANWIPPQPVQVQQVQSSQQSQGCCGQSSSPRRIVRRR